MKFKRLAQILVVDLLVTIAIGGAAFDAGLMARPTIYTVEIRYSPGNPVNLSDQAQLERALNWPTK